MIIAAAAEVHRGWGNTFGILAAVVGSWAVYRVDLYLKERRERLGDPSPTPGGAPLPRETPQVGGVSSHVSPDETPAKPGKVDWWGAVTRMPDGTIRRVWRNARHVTRTGELPQAYGDEPAVAEVDDDDEIDLALGDGPAGHETPPEVAVSVRRETREEYVARCIAAGIPKADIAAALQQHYGLSRATAYRLLPADQAPKQGRAA